MQRFNTGQHQGATLVDSDGRGKADSSRAPTSTESDSGSTEVSYNGKFSAPVGIGGKTCPRSDYKDRIKELLATKKKVELTGRT